MSNSISDSAYRLYSTTVSHAKRCLKPSTIDEIERYLGTVAGGITAISTLVVSGIILNQIPALGIPGSPEDKPTMPHKIFTAIAAPVILYATYKTIQKMKAINARLAASLRPYKKRFIELEIEKFVDSTKNNNKLALIFRPSNDQSEALMRHTELSSLQNSTENHSVSLISGNSKSQMIQEMSSDKNKYHKIIFRSHGNNDRLVIGDQVILRKTSTNTFKWIREHAQNGAIISIEACCAGKGEENIARDISRACPQATVYASMTVVDSAGGVVYDKDGIPSFNYWGLNSTRIYRNGVLISPPTGNERIFQTIESLT